MVPTDHPFAVMGSVSVEDLADTVLVTIADAGVPRYWTAAFAVPPASRTGRSGTTAAASEPTISGMGSEKRVDQWGVPVVHPSGTVQSCPFPVSIACP